MPGEHHTLPLPDGPGKALRLTIRPPRADLPIYLAAVGPRNLRLAGEVADGWLAVFLSPEHSCRPAGCRPRRVARRVGAGDERSDPLAGFDVVATVPVVVTDDLEAGRAAVADYTALYIGGMGSRDAELLQRRSPGGWGSTRPPTASRTSTSPAAPATPPTPCRSTSSDATALIGPPERIAERIGRYADAGRHHAERRALRARAPRRSGPPSCTPWREALRRSAG